MRKPQGSRGIILLGTVLFLFLGIAPPASRGAVSSEDKFLVKFVERNWLNGKAWDKLTYPGKLGYVCGLFDGITLFWAMADAEGVKKTVVDPIFSTASVPSKYTVGDVVDGMDDFYRESKNLSLPAICAYLHFVYRARGEGEEAMKKRLSRWHKIFK